MIDWEAIRRAIDTDPSEAQALLRSGIDRLVTRSRAWGKVGSFLPNDRDDIVQEVLLAITGKPDEHGRLFGSLRAAMDTGVGHQAEFHLWLVISRKIYNQFRSITRRPTVPLDDATTGTLGGSRGFSDPFIRKSIAECFAHVDTGPRDRNCRVLLTHSLRGRTAPEIALLTGVAGQERRIRRQLSACRRKLARCLDGKGIHLHEDHGAKS